MTGDQLKNEIVRNLVTGVILSAAIWAGGALNNSQIDAVELSTKLDSLNSNVTQLRADIKAQRAEDKAEIARWLDQHENRIQRLESLHQKADAPR